VFKLCLISKEPTTAGPRFRCTSISVGSALTSAPGEKVLSRLNGAAHDSGSMRLATPCRSPVMHESPTAWHAGPQGCEAGFDEVRERRKLRARKYAGEKAGRGTLTHTMQTAQRQRRLGRRQPEDQSVSYRRRQHASYSPSWTPATVGASHLQRA
jgi:hypothetical protein